MLFNLLEAQCLSTLGGNERTKVTQMQHYIKVGNREQGSRLTYQIYMHEKKLVFIRGYW